jgi:serine protease Do
MKISASVPSRRFKLILASALLAVAGLAGQAVAAERPYFNDKSVPENRHDLEQIQEALMKALPGARQATVCIDLGEGSGSGVIVSAEGLVLTAAHVAGGVGKPVTIVMEDGRRLKAETLGIVAATDAAMVKITEPGPFPFVELEKESPPRLGDWVFSLGHSGGFDKERGSVVRLGRFVWNTDTTYQSDCKLIGGDSGGPLFDINGRLIGIHSRVGAVLDQSMHVPIKEFVSNWDGLLAGKFIGEGPFAEAPVKGKGFLGIASEPTGTLGLKVTKVGKDSGAEVAGIKVGDVLLRLNGEAVNEKEKLTALVFERFPGDKLVFGVLRDGAEMDITVTLGEK